MENLPKITILIVTLNSERTLQKCLESIEQQNYPKEKIEYLNVDGSSIDSTKVILKQHGFKIIDGCFGAEAKRAIGIAKSKHNLIVSIDSDNYLPNSQWLKQMLRPFIDDPETVHANTLRYGYRKSDSLYNRYVALFGGADPVVYYIGIPDRLSYIQKKWTKGKIIKETKDYYLVEFSKDSLPTVGCNGVVYKRDLLLRFARSRPEEFLHIDVFADLIEKNYNRFAIVKNSVVHDTAITLESLLKKRVDFLSDYYLGKKRRYLIYNSKKLQDNLKLFLFIFYTVTFIKPFVDSLRGYLRVRDRAWFIHPFVCWVYLYAYTRATIAGLFFKKYERFRR